MPTLLFPFPLGTCLGARLSTVHLFVQGTPTGIALERENDAAPLFMLTCVTCR